jgi:cytochrome b561
MSSLQTVPKKPKLNSAFQRLMSVHWWMAGCYLVLFVVGTYMSQLPRTDFRNTLYDFHKSIGVLTMALLTWRILTLIQVVWKKYTKRLPKFSPQWLKNFALHTLWRFCLVDTIQKFCRTNHYAIRQYPDYQRGHEGSESSARGRSD